MVAWWLPGRISWDLPQMSAPMDVKDSSSYMDVSAKVGRSVSSLLRFGGGGVHSQNSVQHHDYCFFDDYECYRF